MTNTYRVMLGKPRMYYGAKTASPIVWLRRGYRLLGWNDEDQPA